MANIQTNVIIKVPDLGLFIEAQLPPTIEGNFIVYSSSSCLANKVYFDPFRLIGLVGKETAPGEGERYMVYHPKDNAIHSSGSWLLWADKNGWAQ